MATPAKRAALGTLAWATAKEGRLSRREQIRELVAAARVTLMGAPAQIRQRLGLPNGSAFALDPDSLSIPDSSIAREAEELCRESSSEMLLNHCLRSYVWGMILGRRDGLRPDPELLYVASMLHDLALTDRFREYAPMPCFGARAGLLANDWARERGWEQVRCSTLADVISLHLNTAVPARHGPEAQLLQAGAGLDVIGLRHWELEPETVAWVLERYPRHALKATINPVIEAEAHPHTRTQLLQRWLLFGSLVRHSQFLE